MLDSKPYNNNEANMAAKLALQFEVEKFIIPYTDFKYSIKCYTNSFWQIFWDFCNISILFKTKWINHITSVLYFKTKLSFQEYISEFSYLLKEGGGGSNNLNAYFTTGHYIHVTVCRLYFSEVIRHISPAEFTIRLCPDNARPFIIIISY